MSKRFLKAFVLLCGCAAGMSGFRADAVPVLSELFYDASGSDAGLVFVELFGSPGESLDGLLLEGVNGTNGEVYMSIGLSGIIPLDGVFVIADSNAGLTSVPNADLITDVDFQNGPDSVVLRNALTVLDAVGYGDFSGGEVFAGEGSAASDPAAGSSIARIDPLLDTDDNSVDFTVLDTPTPGVVPVASEVPLPAAFWLFASGLIPLLSSGRGWRCRLGRGNA